MNRFIFLSTFLLAVACAEHKAPDGFQVVDSLQLTLVAAEPLIRDPVDMAFCSDGRLLVLEMPGYPMEDSQSRIVSLSDIDGDGMYDNSLVFADSLMFATSLLPWKKGVLVAAPPFLLHLKDVNEDGKVEVRDTLMGGFAMDNLQHNFNGLTYGLDGWIYAANGGNSGKPF